MPLPPPVKHLSAAQPCYLPQSDEILLPLLEQFETTANYWSVFYHELVHSTGHECRLNRFASGDRSLSGYSYEELVAEFGAAFLCAAAGIANRITEDLSASYIDGWSAVFRKDPNMLLRAASAAQKAVDFIRGAAARHIRPAQAA